MGELTFLKFSAGPATFGLLASDVIETIRVVEIAPLPGAARDLLGVINVRGRVIPIFDLCRTLEIAERPLSLRMYIVVASVEAEPVGILVDDVLDVVTVPTDAFQVSRAVRSPESYTSGVVRIHDELLTVLNLTPLVVRADAAASTFDT